MFHCKYIFIYYKTRICRLTYNCNYDVVKSRALREETKNTNQESTGIFAFVQQIVFVAVIVRAPEIFLRVPK